MPGLNVNVDFLGAGGVSQGEIAAYMQENGAINPGLMRPFIHTDGKIYVSVYKGSGPTDDPKNYKTLQVNTTGTLRRDEWQMLDEALVPIAEHRLQGTQDLISRGLTFNLANGMGTTVLEWHDVSDALEAELSMDGVTRAKGDRPVFSSKYLPIPIIHADFEINARVLASSRKLGNPLDTTMVERAGRKVAEKLEKMLYTDTSYQFGGGKVYSLVNYDNRNLKTIGTNWTALESDSTGSVGEKILKQVMEMKQQLMDVHFYGPYVINIPSGYEVLLDDDYNEYKNNTIRERIMKIAGIQDIVTVDTLAADNVLMLQTTTDVIRIVRGMDMQTVQWSTEGNWITKYKVVAISVPQIRSDQTGKCGILHMS